MLIGKIVANLVMLLTSLLRLYDGLSEKTRRLNYLLFAFACLPLPIHYTLPHNTKPTL